MVSKCDCGVSRGIGISATGGDGKTAMAIRSLKKFTLLAALLAVLGGATGPQFFTARAQQQSSQRGSTFEGFGGDFTGDAPPPAEPFAPCA